MNKGSKLPGLKQDILLVEKLITGRFRLTLLLLLAIVSLAAPSFATSDHKGEKTSSDESLCEVNNFGKVTDFYYRGAQPEREEYAQLAGLGVKTIVDLRDDPKDYARARAERSGMKYINLPMSDTNYPAQDVVPKFLSIVNDKANWPVFVHCAGGRHRTGAMTAVFRMTEQGWNVERAYEEMKDYDFYKRFGHKPIKQFVFDYYRELTQRRIAQVGNQTKTDPIDPIKR
jgi:tyrosine-protein phosphatase SIW14